MYDPDPQAVAGADAAIRAIWGAMRRAGITSRAAAPNVRACATLAECCSDADYVQESGPDRLEVKQALIRDISTMVGPDVVIASSSSALLASEYQRDAEGPHRVLAAHPFHPAALLPLVEIAGGDATSETAIAWTMTFFAYLRKAPVRVRRETPGYIANRMAAALYREAVDLVASGIATVADVDRAINMGPGLRWAVMGPHLLYHLGGGAGGYRHYLTHLGPGQERRWQTFKSAPLTGELIDELVDGVDAEIGMSSRAELEERRDASIAGILALRAGINRTEP